MPRNGRSGSAFPSSADARCPTRAGVLDGENRLSGDTDALQDALGQQGTAIDGTAEPGVDARRVDVGGGQQVAHGLVAEFVGRRVAVFAERVHRSTGDEDLASSAHRAPAGVVLATTA